MNPDFILMIIKILCGGLVAFLAIFHMSKDRDLSWIFIICGFLLSYVSTVYDSLLQLGVVAKTNICIFGIPVFPLLSIILPTLFFITGFILKILRK